MSGGALRSFLAADLSPQARAQAVRVIEQLRKGVPRGVRWVPEENLHLTLKFLGGVEPERISRLIAEASSKLEGLAPFDVVLGGLGAFPNARRARVVWLGVRAGGAQLAQLARKLDTAAARIGVERERRPYRTHLTLGRLRQPAPVALSGIPCPDGLPFSVEEVVLYESRLSSAGAQYIPLARLRLRTADARETNLAPEM